ncbi:SAM-dependent methyltransferase [Nocardia sp. XZ_19_369]|uniref:SAM-dependent methyltransferase n=1 Tax=Nocardia sp. XZ_19_369 TaxID=2769487 RepID=UPI00188ECB87|nr:SAM-dependent methyltransferase [Nocardia sp. XZ_19_369]
MTDVETLPVIRTDIPQSARMWDFWRGGKDNYEIDRTVGEHSRLIYPYIETIAVQSREFLIRVVSYLAGEAGVHQFIDIGAGLPSSDNTHEVAQRLRPESKIIWVDNDPMVLAHARALLSSTTSKGATVCCDADFHHPEQILAGARDVLNFNEPIAVLFMGVLGHAASHVEMLRIVGTVMDELVSGSYLAVWDGTDCDHNFLALWHEYAETGAAPYVPRSRTQILAAFECLELLDPGLVPINQWRAPDPLVGRLQELPAYGGLGRKP